MILGMLNDAQFGPVVAIGIGGIHAEAIADVAFALPPFDAQSARRVVSKLKYKNLLDGHRGTEAVNVDAFCTMASHFSELSAIMANAIDEIDINPVLVTAGDCVCLDALVVAKRDQDYYRRSDSSESAIT